MIVAGGPSDSGGATEAAGGDGGALSLMLDVLPIGIAVLALFVSLSTFLMNSRKAARDALWSYLQLVVSSETARARSVVTEASRVESAWVHSRRTLIANEARKGRLPSDSLPAQWQAQFDEVRDASLGLLWVVALAGPAAAQRGRLDRLIGWRNTELYRAQVYEHLNLIVPELSKTMRVWEDDLSSLGPAQIVDAALDSLPQTQEYGEGKSISLTAVRFTDSPTTGSESGDAL